MITITAADIKNIPPLPASAVRLAELVEDLNSTVDDFAKVIEFDQVLTGNALRWANSAWSQSQSPIGDIRTAIIRLGAANILKLAIGFHLKQPMSQGCPNYDLDENALWQHSVASALAAENLQRFSILSIPHAAFAAALMHDIGKLVLGRHLGYKDLRQRIQQVIQKKELTYIQAEREITGTDHAEVGAIMAREWKLPDNLVDTIAGHHNPDQRPNLILDTVHIANVVSKLIGLGLGVEQMNMHVSTEAAHRIGLTQSNLQTLCAVVKSLLEETEQQWGMALSQ
jgi:putative nucleotidyltransferase with HDIG domain